VGEALFRAKGGGHIEQVTVCTIGRPENVWVKKISVGVALRNSRAAWGRKVRTRSVIRE